MTAQVTTASKSGESTAIVGLRAHLPRHSILWVVVDKGLPDSSHLTPHWSTGSDASPDECKYTPYARGHTPPAPTGTDRGLVHRMAGGGKGKKPTLKPLETRVLPMSSPIERRSTTSLGHARWSVSPDREPYILTRSGE
ncbi:hypothetical protein ZHAS_00013621 [Anopheles sinensis]|uniref:Uncharacterized protein n=1 Tax=Anopheles sinensis TaxID=74873 RepID=A0A084W5Y5_ANOSI|nr:hypothetical protein ZHAS_00013621 [Anopheles sinensis]